MAQTLDHGGLHYIELIKSNLQFIHGNDYLFEVLTQVTTPEQWQVSVLKTDASTARSVVFFDSGPGLVPALAKLHRRSAEMLAAFLADGAADAGSHVKRRKADVLAKKNEPKKEVERSRNGVEKPPQAEVERSRNGVEKPPQAEEVAKPGESRDVAMAIGCSSDTQGIVLRATSPPLVGSRWEHVSPCRFRGWKSPSPCDEDYEPVSRYEDSSLRPKGFICPNYGPASSFYRVPDARTELAYWPGATSAKAMQDKAELSRPQAGHSASPSAAEAAALAAEAIKSLAPSQNQRKIEAAKEAAERMQVEDMTPVKRIEKSSVLLYISWPSYGSTVVADHCELSVRSLQSRVRHMLRSNGPALFGDALLGAEPPIVFGPDEATSFVVMVKGLRVNGQVVMLGPAFGDDIAGVVKGKTVEGAIRVEIELLWNGRNLRAAAAK